MNLPNIDCLLKAICRPNELGELQPNQWSMLIRQGRSADMLARMGSAAKRATCWSLIPVPPRMHIESALNLANRQQRELRWEVEQITKALQSTGLPVVLLKGAAYVMADLKCARGRLVSDVDILVPHAALSTVEAALMMGGWVSAAKSEYDQRYYRTWMHELPPMQHFKRGTTIDVHHAILPLTARLHPSTDKLLAHSLPIFPGSSIRILAPVDMVLHSAAHLFHEGELEKGLHGLIDIDLLLSEFSTQPDFWNALINRATETELVRPLFYALRYASIMLHTEVPDAVIHELDHTQGASVPKPILVVMDTLFLRALRPPHPSTSDLLTPAARGLLYLRGHWLRMPFLLLSWHLARKTWFAWFPKKTLPTP